MTVETWAAPLLSLLLGYILGSIPFGVLLTRLGGAGDLRSIGSGNIGATNVLRTGRKELAALTLLLDGAKGAVAVIIVRELFPGHEQMAALAALVGHLYPIWLRFKGGKGVATFFGLMAALHWESSIFFAALWLGTLSLTRFSSVAGMSAALMAPVAAAAFLRFDLALLYLGMALLVIWKHRANVERLMAGTEPRVGGTKDA
ncbi:glycerol-3-phosphate 1-O-acyltransferase PlsY [Sphingosinicella humi]|uniref:glycerol-3-phosphate 1-O-acyltransferase PlsY n=1 Tax=Allosphingosinicella humi TaxID=2068657 RepID=UPI001FB069BC|nr:glycerol-3-phosphate 1-O-acyltransferase PlsY [Sphingosinicella humi]